MENEVKEVEEMAEVEKTEEKSHHHHHHSHHHSHHHHKSSKKKKKFSLKRFVRKHKTACRVAVLVLVLVLTVTATVLVIKQMDKAAQDGTPTVNKPTTAPQIPAGQVAVSVTRFDGPVMLHHDVTQAYLNTIVSVSPEEILGEYRQMDVRLDQGQPVELAFDVLGIAEGCNITGARVEITQQGQSQPVFHKDCGAGENRVLVYNLKTSASYRYSIRVDFTTMNSITVTGSFETAAGPRLIRVDGAANVRDFGGWKTAAGKQINQGLLFRGSELDGVVETKFNLTEIGKQTLVNELGIKMELDLRQTSERSDVDRLGSAVKCPDPYNAPFFAGAFESDKTDSVCRVFKDLANPENYPIYMHCTFGRDRTGTVCLILGAVLGMEEEDLLHEYGLSALYYSDADYSNARAVLDGLKAYGGDSLEQQAENYLLDIGVTAEEIASLRQIYLG